MKILEDYNIKSLNTFGVPARARFFVEIQNENEISELLTLPIFKSNPYLFLGGGSNILFTKNFEGIVVLNKLKGISILAETDTDVLVRSMSGEGWNDLVDFAVKRGYWGIENLASIPGTVGGSPVQNIGAYGVELAQTLHEVEVFEIDTGKKIFLSNSECDLGYRDSIFKNKAKGKYFISAVTFKFHKEYSPKLEYRALKDYLQKHDIKIRTPEDISTAVSEIRSSKLPDPKLIGNAGSFFKNVFVDKEKFDLLLSQYGDMPHFEEDGLTKIPAGWLIENTGPDTSTSWKGYRLGCVGIHDKQALVLVNHGGATGEEIRIFSEKIISSVRNKFGLTLTPEVNFV